MAIKIDLAGCLANRKIMANMEIEKLSNQGNDALHKGNYEKAFSCWNKILQLDPNNTDALVFRGITRVGKEDLDGIMQSMIGTKLSN